MPLYTFTCRDCQQSDELFLKLGDYLRQREKQKCSHCGGKMRRAVDVPTLAGLDSGPDGFMRGRQESDGCADAFTRERVRKNAGGNLGGRFWVPGLCREGKQFDDFALCSSRQEVIDKAKKLGVGVRGPGINVEPTISDAAHKAKEEDNSKDYAPSEKALKYSIYDEVVKQHGGKVTRKQYREIVEKLKERHGSKRRPKAPEINSIYPEGT